MLSEIVAILIREYQRRGHLDKVRDLIEKHGKTESADRIEYHGFSISSIGTIGRSPLKDRRLLKLERHKSVKVSRTLRLT